MTLSILPIRPNRLAFPGTKPGFDPTHPASRNCVMSGIALSGQGWMVNLVNGSPFIIPRGTVVASTAAMDPILGPCIYNPTGNNGAIGVLGLNQIITSLTIAVMVTVRSLASTYQDMTTLGLTASNLGSFGLWINASGTPNCYISNDNFASFNLSLGASYFLAVSVADMTTTGAALNFVARNLKTGGILTSAGVSANSINGHDYNITVGEDANEPSLSNIAASVYSRTFLSMPQLLQWAQDPWSFWYPQRSDLAKMIYTATAAAPVIPKGATLPMMGVG